MSINNNFEKALEVVLKNEGGYSNDPDDLGGETYYGISRVHHPSWEGWKIVDRYKNLTRLTPTIKPSLEVDEIKSQLKPLVHSLYKEKYWDASNLDEINSIEIAFKIFDMNVNLGIHTAGAIVQNSINMISKTQEIKVDKIIGSLTTSLINSITSKNEMKDLFINILTLMQGNFYIKLATNNPNQRKFIKGWINRLKMKVNLEAFSS